MVILWDRLHKKKIRLMWREIQHFLRLENAEIKPIMYLKKRHSRRPNKQIRFQKIIQCVNSEF
jgi:hypothetical protein